MKAEPNDDDDMFDSADLGITDLIKLETDPLVENTPVPVKDRNNVLRDLLHCESHMKSEEDPMSQLYLPQSNNNQLYPSSAKCNSNKRHKNKKVFSCAAAFDYFGKGIPWVDHEGIPTDSIKDILLLELNANIGDFEKMAQSLKPRVPDEHDWAMLLRQNKKLLVNMIFGLYLSAKDAETQIQWLKAESSPCACHLKVCQFQDAQTFLRDDIKLFNDDLAMQNAYLGFSHSLTARFPVTPSSRGFLLELLFFYSGKIRLNDPETALQECMPALLQIPIAKEKSQEWLIQTISEVGETLEAMSVLFEHSGLISHKLAEYPVKPVEPQSNSAVMEFTMEEDLWLSAKKNEVFSCMEEIQMGPVFSEEVLRFNLHRTPPSPKFGASITNGFKERLWRFFCLHSEFQDLSRENQAHLVQSTVHIFWALMASRLSGVQVAEQVNFLTSEHELNSDLALKQVAHSQPQTEDCSGIKIHDVFPSVPAKLMTKHVQELQPFVRRGDDDITFFALLVLSTCGNAIPNNSTWKGMRSLAKRYELIVARRFAARKEAAQIHRAVSSLHIMASMLPIPL